MMRAAHKPVPVSSCEEENLADTKNKTTRIKIIAVKNQ